MNSRPQHRKNKLNQRDPEEPIATKYEVENPSWQSNSKVGSRRRVFDKKANYTWKYKNKTGGLQFTDLSRETIIGYKGNFNRNENPSKEKMKIKSTYASEGAKMRNDWIKYVKTAQEAWFIRHNELKTYPCVLSDPILQLMYHAVERMKTNSYLIKKPVMPSIYPFVKWADIVTFFEQANQPMVLRDIISGATQPSKNNYNPFDRLEGESNEYIDQLIQEKNLWMDEHPGKFFPFWSASEKMASQRINSSMPSAPPLFPSQEDDFYGFDTSSDLTASTLPQQRKKARTTPLENNLLMDSSLISQQTTTMSSTNVNMNWLNKPMLRERKIQLNDRQIVTLIRDKSFDVMRPFYLKALSTVIKMPNNYRLLYDRTLWIRKPPSSFHTTTVETFKKLSTPASWISADNIEDYCIYYNFYARTFNQYFIHPQQYISWIERSSTSKRVNLKNYQKWIIIPRRELENDHWFVITVQFFPVSKSSTDTKIEYDIDVYDSLENDPSQQREKVINKIKQFIETLFENTSSLQNMVSHRNTNINFPIIQKDGFSCGIFTLLTMLFLFQNEDPMADNNRINLSSANVEKLRELFSGFLATNVNIMPPVEENDTNRTASLAVTSSNDPLPLQMTGIETSKRLLTTMEMKIRGDEMLKKMRRKRIQEQIDSIPTTTSSNTKTKQKKSKPPIPKREPSTRTKRKNQLTGDYEDITKKR